MIEGIMKKIDTSKSLIFSRNVEDLKNGDWLPFGVEE